MIVSFWMGVLVAGGLAFLFFVANASDGHDQCAKKYNVYECNYVPGYWEPMKENENGSD